MKKTFIIIVAIAFLAGIAVVTAKLLKYQKEPVPAEISIAEVISEDEEKLNKSAPVTENDASKDVNLFSSDIPEELNLAVPFYSQAPFGNWDYPWQEACEEASVLLVANAYFGHNWTREEFNEQILKLVEYEKEIFGAYEHTTIKQTAQILNDHLGLRTVIHENPTLDDIKHILAKGHLIVMTFSGKDLGNPFYTNGGPIYHAMVAKGYKAANELIFHDVGTRRGENYVYSWDVIQNSLHDYAEPITDGAKRIIEVIPIESTTGTETNG